MLRLMSPVVQGNLLPDSAQGETALQRREVDSKERIADSATAAVLLRALPNKIQRDRCSLTAFTSIRCGASFWSELLDDNRKARHGPTSGKRQTTDQKFVDRWHWSAVQVAFSGGPQGMLGHGARTRPHFAGLPMEFLLPCHVPCLPLAGRTYG